MTTVDFWKRMIEQHERDNETEGLEEDCNHDRALRYVTQFIETEKPSRAHDVLSWMVWVHASLYRDGVLRIYYDVLDSTAFGESSARVFFKTFIEYADALRVGKPEEGLLRKIRSEFDGISATTDEFRIYLLLYKYALCTLLKERLDYDEILDVIEELFNGTEKSWVFFAFASLIRAKELGELGPGREVGLDDAHDYHPWIAYMEAAEYAVKWFAFCQLVATGDDDFMLMSAARVILEIQTNAERLFPDENVMNLDTYPLCDRIRAKYKTHP